MIPIAKNVTVVDERGNVYEATYPKRAKGLVKSGRARFVDDNKICLACPPNIILEDKNMTNQDVAAVLNEDISKIIREHPGMIEDGAGELILSKIGEVLEQNAAICEPELSMGYVLERIDKILNAKSHLDEVVSELRQMEVAGSGDVGTQAKATALSDVVKCQATTNQRLLQLFEKMYDDLKPQKPRMLDSLLEAVSDLPPEQKQALIAEQLSRHW